MCPNVGTPLSEAPVRQIVWVIGVISKEYAHCKAHAAWDCVRVVAVSGDINADMDADVVRRFESV